MPGDMVGHRDSLEFIHRLFKAIDPLSLAAVYDKHEAAGAKEAMAKLVTLAKISSRVIGASQIVSKEVEQRLYSAGINFPSALTAYLLMNAVEAFAKHVVGYERKPFENFFVGLPKDDRDRILSCFASIEKSETDFLMRTENEIEEKRRLWLEVEPELRTTTVADLLAQVYRHPFTHRSDIYDIPRGPDAADLMFGTKFHNTSYICHDRNDKPFYYQVSYAVEKNVLDELFNAIGNSMRRELTNLGVP